MAGGLLAGAAVVVFYSVYFIFITLAEGIQAMGLPRWASFLIVTVFMLLVAAVLGWLGIRKMKTVQPSPDRAIAEPSRRSPASRPHSHTPAPSCRRRRPRGTRASPRRRPTVPPPPQRHPGHPIDRGHDGHRDHRRGGNPDASRDA